MGWVAGLIICLLLATETWANPPDATASTAEGWAWAQIRDGKIADFNLRPGCNGRLDTRQRQGSDDPCRDISPEFLENLLTKREWYGWLPRPRVRLRGAQIKGTIDLSSAEVRPEVWIDNSRIDGSLDLAESHWDHLLSLVGTDVTGDFLARRMMTSSSLLLTESRIKGDVDLSDAEIGGDIAMDGARFAAPVRAERLKVAQNLIVRGAGLDDGLWLPDAAIGGALVIDNSALSSSLMASNLAVGRGLFMHGTNFLGRVILIGTKVGGDLDVTGASFAHSVDLSGINIAQDLLLSGPSDDISVKWLPRSSLILRSAQVGGAIFDSNESWPHTYDISGFVYGRFADIRNRDASWWLSWLSANKAYDPQPYAQLASALTKSGNLDSASAILFAGKNVETSLRYVHNDFVKWTEGLISKEVVGYWIYPFRILYWFILLIVFGAFILSCSAEGRKRSGFWLIGASAQKILLVIKINQEFEDYFNDPQRSRVTAWQMAVFCALTILGWLLGLVLIGLIQGVVPKLGG